MFKANVGTFDRLARVFVGLFLMWYGYDHQSWWGLLGLAVFMTGVFGTCGLYTLIGFSTCPIKTGEASRPVPPVKPVV
ncbi:MAG: DUF2892 domain-containing protein [Candidatus Moraniibacteriota bacterium]